MQIEELRLREINTFLDLLNTRSVRELARTKGIQPGQISKLISSLEQKLGVQLLERSAKGVQLTPKAHELIPFFQGMKKYEDKLSGHFHQATEKHLLSIASTSFFSTHLIPQVLSAIERRYPDWNCRLLDLPPDKFIPVALRSGYQVCIHLDDLDWPKTWTSAQVGQLKWALFCRTGHPVLHNPSQKEVLKYPFIYPIYWTQDGVLFGNDSCPLPVAQRVKGYETSTATSAVEIMRLTDQLAFLPELVVSSYLRSGVISRINIRSWKKVFRPVYLSAKNDILKQKTFMFLKDICAKELEAASTIP